MRRRRKALDLTQEQLADGVCCSQFTICKIEAGERRPSRHLVQRLIACLQVSAPERDAFVAAARGTAGVHAERDDKARVADDGAEPSWPMVGRGDLLAGLGAALRRAAQAIGSETSGLWTMALSKPAAGRVASGLNE